MTPTGADMAAICTVMHPIGPRIGNVPKQRACLREPA